MNGEMINYYFLKDVIKHIPSEIECELIYDDSLLFNFANFLNVPKFYCLYNLFKKDKYDLNKKFEEDFNTFFLECAIYLHQLNDYKRLFFLYSILAINNFKKRLNPYLEKVKDKNDSFEKCYNMLDTYLANKEQIDLTTTPLYELFNNAFIYYDYVEDLIHIPLLRAYKFMGSSGYFKKSYKRFRHFAKKNTTGKYKKGFYNLFDHMFGKNKQKKKYFLYTKDMNMNLLNLKDDESKELSQETFNDVWEISLKTTLEDITALNDYLFAKNEKNFRKRFNIPQEKKL